MKISDITKTESGKMWAIVWPLIITNMLQAIVGMVDFKMVGILGVTEIAAVGMSRQVMMFIMVLMIAISGGASVLVANAFGAKDSKRVSEVAGRSMLIMLITAIFIICPAGFFLAQPFLKGLGGAPKVVELGTSYLKILFVGGVFTMFNFGVSHILLGVGKTRVSLVLLIIVNLLNILFNYIFIFGLGPIPAYGVNGAAIGTVISRALGAGAGVWILMSARFPIQAKIKDALKFDAVLLGRLFVLGGPRSLQGVVRNFSRLATIMIINLLPLSTIAMSAYSVGMQVRMLSSFVGLAFMSASMARVGQNKGAGDLERARQSGWIAAFMAAGIMSVIAFVLFIIPEQIMGFFTKDLDAIRMGRAFFMIVALGEPFMAFSFALSGGLRGGGDTLAPFVYSSIADLGIAIVLGYVFAIVLDMGFPGIAIGLSGSAVMRAIPMIIRYVGGKWQTMRVQ